LEVSNLIYKPKADDFITDFGIERTETREELDFVRKLFALQCHGAGVASMDTPWVNFKDLEGLRKELRYLKQIGMKGKFVIHPSNVEVVNDAFLPTEQEVAYSRRLVTAFEAAMKDGKAAITFEERMVDMPVYKRALNTLRLADLKKK